MPKQKVYISSTFTDLKDFRENLRTFFDKEAAEDFELCQVMEHMYDDATSKPFLNTCVDEVKKCDIYIIILGHRVGSFPPGDTERTYTEHEYDTALAEKKLVLRLVYKNFDETLCDNIEKYNKFLEKFEGLHTHLFTNITEFEKEYLKIFYTLKPATTSKFNEAEYIATIDRDKQIKIMNFTRVKFGTKKILYYYYFSQLYDFAHMLNFRISNLEMDSYLYQFNEEYWITLEAFEFIEDENVLTEYFVQEIAAKVYGNAGEQMLKIEDLYLHLNKQSTLKNLIIPIKINHSIETNNPRFEAIGRVISKFSAPEYLNLLVDRSVVFLLNIQYEKKETDITELNKVFTKLKENLSLFDLGKLELVSNKTLENWIREKIDSNPIIAQGYLTKYFPGNDSTTMAERVDQAKKLINELYN